jgi:hypothetical protein
MIVSTPSKNSFGNNRNPCQVADLIDGRLFPPPAKILSATIRITFVGPKGLCELTMLAMFRVDVVEREHGGYVPTDAADEMEGKHHITS